MSFQRRRTADPVPNCNRCCTPFLLDDELAGDVRLCAGHYHFLRAAAAAALGRHPVAAFSRTDWVCFRRSSNQSRPTAAGSPVPRKPSLCALRRLRGAGAHSRATRRSRSRKSRKGKEPAELTQQRNCHSMALDTFTRQTRLSQLASASEVRIGSVCACSGGEAAENREEDVFLSPSRDSRGQLQGQRDDRA